MNKTIYRQYDSRWGGKPYPTKASTFSGNGCGCVACTHILIEMTKYKNTTPEPVRQYMVSQGFAVAKRGTTWSGIPKTLNHYGFKATEHATMPEIFKVLDKRKKNKQACLGVILFGEGSRGGVTWTASGHYVAFTDYKVENGKHYFYTKDSGPRCNDGWHAYETTMKGLIPKIWSAEMPKEKKYTGNLPTTKLVKTNAETIRDTVKWAKWIADGIDFHYGCNEHAFHNGCYFCGTQEKFKKGHGMKMWETTYCCNPFVGAAWAHGGGDATAYKMCHNCNSWGFKTSEGYEKSSLFDKLGKPAKSKLKAGDVLCNWTHVALYVGDGKIAEASGLDDNVYGSEKWKNSIAVKTLTDAKYKNFERCYRYNGKVNVERNLTNGEVSDRVADMQKFLIWYGATDVKAHGIFDARTLKAVKAFQEKEMGKGQGDGIVGPKTIAKMSTFK